MLRLCCEEWSPCLKFVRVSQGWRACDSFVTHRGIVHHHVKWVITRDGALPLKIGFCRLRPMLPIGLWFVQLKIYSIKAKSIINITARLDTLSVFTGYPILGPLEFSWTMALHRSASALCRNRSHAAIQINEAFERVKVDLGKVDKMNYKDEDTLHLKPSATTGIALTLLFIAQVVVVALGLRLIILVFPPTPDGSIQMGFGSEHWSESLFQRKRKFAQFMSYKPSVRNPWGVKLFPWGWGPALIFGWFSDHCQSVCGQQPFWCPNAWYVELTGALSCCWNGRRWITNKRGRICAHYTQGLWRLSPKSHIFSGEDCGRRSVVHMYPYILTCELTPVDRVATSLDIMYRKVSGEWSRMFCRKMRRENRPDSKCTTHITWFS